MLREADDHKIIEIIKSVPDHKAWVDLIKVFSHSSWKREESLSNRIARKV